MTLTLQKLLQQPDTAEILKFKASVDGSAFDEMPMPELSIDDLDLTAAQVLFGHDRRLDEQSLLTLRLQLATRNALLSVKPAMMRPAKLLTKRRSF